ITLFVAGIFSLELVNSAIERAVAKPDENHYNFAGAAKDIAAGAVLIFAIASGIVGVILFWDKAVLFNIFNFFTQKIWALGLLVLFLIVSFLFVFRNEDNSIGK
ncbi:MAG: diacylglycerol kinase family protein, partial [Oscillospiraceae bacterium]